MSDAEEQEQEQTKAALREAVEGAIRETEHGIATRYVLLVESVGADGERGVWLCADKGAKVWDTLGLLQYGLAVEQADTTVAALRNDDD